MKRIALASLSKDDLIALVLAQSDVTGQRTAHNEILTGQTATLTKRIAAPEEKLGKPS